LPVITPEETLGYRRRGGGGTVLESERSAAWSAAGADGWLPGLDAAGLDAAGLGWLRLDSPGVGWIALEKGGAM
jgi:hypothetical protein